MKAIQITSYDGPRGLTYDTLPEPEPAPEQVALNVEFAGANYVEALFAGGFVPKPLPWVPGIEATGRSLSRTPSSSPRSLRAWIPPWRRWCRRIRPPR